MQLTNPKATQQPEEKKNNERRVRRIRNPLIMLSGETLRNER
jgi:hypothetical protein